MTTNQLSDVPQYAMAYDIEQNAHFVSLMSDDYFCLQLWAAGVSHKWVKSATWATSEVDHVVFELTHPRYQRIWRPSFLRTAKVIAHIRNVHHNKHENYLNWYSLTHLYRESDAVTMELYKLGWTPLLTSIAVLPF